MSRVGVVIPTYNRAHYLSQAISSALAQPIDDLDVLVVDDGSTDETREVVAGFSDRRLRYVHQANQGMTAAFNTGIARSRGECISILGDDDWYLPGGLAALAEELLKQPEVGLTAGGYMYVDETGRLLHEVRAWLDHPSLALETWLFWCPVLLQAAVIRRDWIDRIGGLRSGLQDWDLGLRLSRAGCRMAWVETLVFAYRLHARQSIRDAGMVRREFLSILDEFFADSGLPGDIRARRTEAYVHAFLKSAVRAFEAGDLQGGRADIERAIQLDPRVLNNRGQQIFDVLVGWGSGSLASDPDRFLRAAFGHLPDAAAAVRTRQREAKAMLAMSACFAAHAQGDRFATGRALLEGVWHEPAWLRNVGVLSIAAQAAVGPKAFAIGQRFMRGVRPRRASTV